MVGQEHVVQALSNALTQQRLHHAYLFTGTRGVGKTTVSRILAKSLNCQGPDGQGGITATPCGVCQACTDIDSGRFVDYTELDAASNRGVDEVQSLLEQAVYKPVQGRFKVFMIDEVHMLTGHAFNAMLKTLEEPPEYLKFVLATTDPQKVPVTVLSRCLQFNLRPMAPETMQEHLVQVLRAEGVRGRRRRRCACWRAPRAAPCAMRCRSPTRRSPSAAAQLEEAGGAPDAGQRGPQPCVPPDRGAGAGRRQDGGRDLRGAAPAWPECRVHAGGNERRAAAHGRDAGRAAARATSATPRPPRSRAWPR